MDPVLKTKWLAALRSGEYKQGKHFLVDHNAENNETTHCCLGVLCEVAGSRRLPSVDGYMVNYVVCTEELADYAFGLTLKIQKYLMSMNDNQGKSFNEIADWIEENL